MIYTVTFNPAIDYVMHTEELLLGETNRSRSEEIYFGGKGINVSLILKELGVPSKALGFIAGFTGKAIEQGLRAAGVETDFVELKEGCSRINVKIKGRKETEVNGRGPFVDEEALSALLQKIDKLQGGDVLVLAGSISGGMPSDVYEKIAALLSDRQIGIVVDATKELLLNALKYRPFLIKPNTSELGELFGVQVKTEEEILFYAKKLKDMGAVNVLVSRAGDGAILVDEFGGVHSCGVCKGKVKNSVGAGDSMVAGFLAGSAEKDYDYALKLGTATGGATAFSDGLATREEIFSLLKTL